MKDLALKKKKKKSKVKERKGKRDTEWQTATKGPRQLCHEAGKAKKGEKEKRGSKERTRKE